MSNKAVLSDDPRVQAFLDWLLVPKHAVDVTIEVPLRGPVKVSYHVTCIAHAEGNVALQAGPQGIKHDSGNPQTPPPKS